MIPNLIMGMPERITTLRVAKRKTHTVPILADVREEICSIFDVEWSDIASKRRFGRIVIFKQLFCYVADKITRSSLLDISNYLGGKQHSNAHHHKEKAKGFIKNNDPVFMPYWNKFISESKIWKQ